MARGDSLKALSRNDMMLIGLLLDRPMHGYELAEVLSGLGQWADMGRTSVYYTLGRLERDGLVTKHVERHGDKPERSVYSMTEEGRNAFFRSIEETLRAGSEPLSALDVAIFYSNRLDQEAVVDAVRERIASLEEEITESVEQMSRDGEGSAVDLPLRLVLQRRLALLRANVEFLEGLVELASGRGADRAAGAISGTLDGNVLHELIRTLATAKRTGLLTVAADAGTVTFALHRGLLYGYAPDLALGDEESLVAVFTTARGASYHFVATEEIPEGLVNASGATEVILKGCRGVMASTAFETLVPDPQSLLDARDGMPAGIDEPGLTEAERRLMEVVDGVKTITDLAARLATDEMLVARIAYPLWAAGFLVRTGTTKRSLVQAVGAYAHRWLEAVELFGGAPAREAIEHAVCGSQRSSHSCRFALDPKQVSEFDFPEGVAALAVLAGDFVDGVLDVVEEVVGEAFVNDVLAGYAADISGTHLETLVKHRAVPERVLEVLESRIADEGRRRRRR